MIKADQRDKQLVVKILSDSFQDNKSVNYVIRQDGKRIDRIRKLMDYSFNMCMAFGEVWISDDRKGCALILHPEKKRTTHKTILWDLQLAWTAIGLNRVMTVMDRESRIKSHHPKSMFRYLWFISVDPQFQNKGIGSSLLREVLDSCEKEKLPVYLETSVDKNLSWYQKFGFEIFQTIQFSYDLYMMRKIIR